MVTRIPSPLDVVPAPLRQAANNPPYPTATTMPAAATELPERKPSFEHIDTTVPSAPNGEGSRSRASSISSHGTWNSDASEEEGKDNEQLPEVLKPGPKKSGDGVKSRDDIPASLKPAKPKAPTGAHPMGTPIWAQQQAGTASFQSQNPYNTGNMAPQATPSPVPQQLPVELPTVKTPEEEIASLSILDQPINPNHGGPGLPLSGHYAAGDVKHDATGQSTTSQASRSSNPWQDALDKEKAKTSLQIAAASIASAPNLSATDKGKQPVSNHLEGSSLPSLDLSGTTSTPAPRPEVETPRTKATRQRNESYSIKHVSWFDASSKTGGALRQSPILMQNANGPCPLLALVNALSLSTPQAEMTSLVQTLKTREQVSLGLLLDAVFEELVRRNERTGRDLPDIGDLYAFLITLHTGMNVNPAFTGPSPSQPGTFEQTKEMQLYGSFDIPLIHGWTAPVDSAVYQAFGRSANTFDEALNMQFLEEEFESKLRSGGLNAEEQQVFEDLTAVKDFLTTFPTQLSTHGLQTMGKWMQPGQFAILFRNDHFCTLYKEPEKGTLMTLVTDAGYSTHDEVVWESLVDVNGANAELYSGDFRPVGAAPSASRQNSAAADSNDGWQTIPPALQQGHKALPNTVNVPAAASQAEQEDLDLALALQLQEEEEEAHRREAASRENARNESLSRQYLDRESNDEQRPPIPPRRSQRNTSSGQYNGPIQASSRTNEGTAPPPTYEQAASDMPYREAGSTPRIPRQGNPLNALSALDAQRQQSAFAAQSGQQGPVMAPNYGRRRQSRWAPGQPGYAQQGSVGSPREEKCIVM